MENRHGLCVDLSLARATGRGRAGGGAADAPPLAGPRLQPQTLGGDKGFDTTDFLADVRAEGVTPHVAQQIIHHRGADDPASGLRAQPALPEADRGIDVRFRPPYTSR
jgi:hypothetical protein